MITNTTRRFLTILITGIFTIWFDRRYRKYTFIPLLILLIGFILPQNMIQPVKGASTSDWDINSFWAYPWGNSVTHKGIDIFQIKGTDVVSSTHGWVVYTYEGGKGGKSVMILGPKWRFHYYAHLDEIKATPFVPVKRGAVIGTVGDTGNAKGKPPHLHYAITSPFPYVNRYDKEAIHGWKKMFYLNPDTWLR
ncbi:MAG: M23 family metallopeptidase [Flavobacteriaceae bacterium]|nr:M23 family metallopeptidase [Flavobacteriaceae bacterium]